MAIEDIVVDFHGGTPADITGKTINAFNGGSGTLSSDLLGFDTGATQGVSLSTSQSLTGSTGGRSVSSPSSELATELNAQGSFAGDLGAGGTLDLTFTVPSSVTAVDVIVHHCTTFNGQTDTDIDINGTIQTGINATGNTTGTFSTFSAIAPNGSDQIIVSLEDTDVSNGFFIFANAIRLENFVESSGLSVNVGLSAETDSALSVSPDGVTSVSVGISSEVDSALSISPSSVGFIGDTFDGTGSLGSQWSVFDNSGGGVTNVGRVSDYFEGTVSDNTGNQTRWFNSEQGRIDYQTIEVPSSGFDEYILKGVGVGPTANRLNDLPFLTSQFSFCGLMVHDNTLATATSMFAVVGHRGGSAQATIEIKGTTAGSSDVTDEGTDVFTGTGVTHGDLAVEVDSSGVCKFKYRDLDGSTWTYINSGTGLVPSSFSMGSSGTQFKIGIIGYASDTIGVPFKFTADSFIQSADQNVDLGQANETDSALNITPSLDLTVNIGISSELDSALTITPSAGTVVNVGISSEIDSALSIAPEVDLSINIGLASEVDESLSVTPASGLSVNIGLSEEVNISLSITPTSGSTVQLGIAEEADSALVVGISLNLIVNLGLASESDIALSISAQVSSGIVTPASRTLTISIELRTLSIS